ncbi:phosphoribosyltransferase domain-containing protein [Candidatus Kaiserbacteria bacterium]|nr:phosphoribosyltransferase domain-containing protein [Candidatus Kaiserbacteria bacterium]
MDWKKFDKEIRSLAGRIDWKPDAVIGIVRGGVIPAMVLANSLKVKKFYIIKVRHVGEGRKVKGDFAPGVAGMKILLVEDMLETGKSLAAAKKYLEERGAEVKTACLYTMPRSEIRPDFSLKEVTNVVPFPWE